jgi:cephalosporin hydroxylase
VDAELVAKIFHDRPAGEARIVILDSDHAKAHVKRELALFAPHLPVGGYIVVEDSNVNGHPVLPDFGPGPWEAVEEFLAGTGDFVPDLSRERFLMTFNPRGYLKRAR